MNDKIKHVIALLKSWETGYISPSAQMAIKEARELIEQQLSEIDSLKTDIENLECEISSLEGDIEELRSQS